MWHGVDDELTLVHCGGYRIVPVEVDLDLSRLRPARARAHDPAGSFERPDHRGAEYALSADYESAVGAFDFHDELPPIRPGPWTAIVRPGLALGEDQVSRRSVNQVVHRDRRHQRPPARGRALLPGDRSQLSDGVRDRRLRNQSV